MNTLDQSLGSIKDTFLTTSLSSFQFFACGIALIMTILFIGHITSTSWLKLESINLSAASRPLIIAFVISVYPVLIIPSLDFIGESLSSILTESIEFKKQNITKLQSQVETNIRKRVQNKMDYYGVDLTDAGLQDYIEKNRGENLSKSFVSQLSKDSLYTPTEQELVNFLEINRPDLTISGDIDLTGKVVTWLVSILEKVSGAFIRVMSNFCLIILTLFGPITFAFSILPAFANSLSSWFARYIQISLWIPLSQIFTYIVISTKEIVLMQSNGVADAISSPNLTLLILSIVSAITMFMIPSISEWIIQSSGAGAVVSGISRGLSSSVDKALLMGRK